MNNVWGFDYGLRNYKYSPYKISIPPISNTGFNFNVDFSKGFEVGCFNSTDTKKQPKVFNISTFNSYEKQCCKEAFRYCQRCFTKNPNDEELMFYLGYCYQQGIGTPVNKKRAFECYKKANELDKTDAYYWNELGYCYQHGIGTGVNKKRAFECYKKANELDKTVADYWAKLGYCYLKGIGTPVNEKRAFECYKKANELDKTDACYWGNLGYCYLKGIGTEIDKEKAKELFQKALELKPDNKAVEEVLVECDE